MHRAKDGTTVQAYLMRASDFALAGCRAIGPAFRGGGTAADPNDRSEREHAQQTNAGLKHSGGLPFQIAARSAYDHKGVRPFRPRGVVKSLVGLACGPVVLIHVKIFSFF